MITPAGYAFSIWGLIYLLLLGFVVNQWLEYFKGWKDESLSKSGIWFTLANVFNGLWIIVWTSEQLGFSVLDRKSTRLNSSHVRISYAVFCLKKKKKKKQKI